MQLKSVRSYKELESGLSSNRKSFLLLYKGGAEQSECALNRISEMKTAVNYPIFTADVNQVRDIHERLNVDTVPSLMVFNQEKVVNMVKGCQTEPGYRSVLEGREIGFSETGNAIKARQVTVYSTPTCSWCTTMKTYLKENRVAFREINVATDNATAEAMVRKSGQQGVPQIEINGQMIVGFDKARINQLLDIH